MNECSNYDNMQGEVDYLWYEAINAKIDFISKLFFFFFVFTQTQMTGKMMTFLQDFIQQQIILQSMRIKQVHHIIFTLLLVITSTISILTGWKNLKRLSFTLTFYIKSYSIKKKICLL